MGPSAHGFILTARSGRHTVRHVLAQAGITLGPEEFERVFRRFIDLADRTKEVPAAALAALAVRAPAKASSQNRSPERTQ